MLKRGFTPELVWLVSQRTCAFSRDLDTVMIRVENLKNKSTTSGASLFFGITGYKAWSTFRTCCTVSTWLEFNFSLARIRSYMVYFGRVRFQVNFTGRITSQAWWFSNNLGFSMCQTWWSTFCLNFSRVIRLIDTFHTVLYRGQSIWK